MGVAGILPRLAPVMQSINIRKIRNSSHRVNDSQTFESNTGHEGSKRKGYKRKLSGSGANQ